MDSGSDFCIACFPCTLFIIETQYTEKRNKVQQYEKLLHSHGISVETSEKDSISVTSSSLSSLESTRDSNSSSTHSILASSLNATSALPSNLSVGNSTSNSSMRVKSPVNTVKSPVLNNGPQNVGRNRLSTKSKSPSVNKVLGLGTADSKPTSLDSRIHAVDRKPHLGDTEVSLGDRLKAIHTTKPRGISNGETSAFTRVSSTNKNTVVPELKIDKVPIGNVKQEKQDTKTAGSVLKKTVELPTGKDFYRFLHNIISFFRSTFSYSTGLGTVI